MVQNDKTRLEGRVLPGYDWDAKPKSPNGQVKSKPSSPGAQAPKVDFVSRPTRVVAARPWLSVKKGDSMALETGAAGRENSLAGDDGVVVRLPGRHRMLTKTGAVPKPGEGCPLRSSDSYVRKQGEKK